MHMRKNTWRSVIFQVWCEIRFRTRLEDHADSGVKVCLCFSSLPLSFLTIRLSQSPGCLDVAGHLGTVHTMVPYATVIQPCQGHRVG